VKAADVRALRKELGCTAKELAQALGLEPEIVTAWEAGEQFPTKQWVDRLAQLRAAGPSSVPRRPRKGQPKSPMERLADPALWALVRKLLEHPDLYAEVPRIAEGYSDPADGTPGSPKK
jgi:transcriptional regulator with XRE-family HTH domain